MPWFVAACSSPRGDEAPARTTRSIHVRPLVGTSFAGRNNPDDPRGEEDNIAIVLGAVLSLDRLSLRPELHWGEDSVQWTPSLCYDFPLAGEGPGSIRGHLGLGYSFLDQRENNVLGNTPSPFLRLGLEGSLVHELIVGASLMVAPHGYEREHTAIAGSTQVGIRF